MMYGKRENGHKDVLLKVCVLVIHHKQVLFSIMVIIAKHQMVVTTKAGVVKLKNAIITMHFPRENGVKDVKLFKVCVLVIHQIKVLLEIMVSIAQKRMVLHTKATVPQLKNAILTPHL
jgi:hypothetical protein